jgi:hypothetical protein
MLRAKEGGSCMCVGVGVYLASYIPKAATSNHRWGLPCLILVLLLRILFMVVGGGLCVCVYMHDCQGMRRM